MYPTSVAISLLNIKKSINGIKEELKKVAEFFPELNDDSLDIEEEMLKFWHLKNTINEHFNRG